jgi:four helix bundle protein
MADGFENLIVWQKSLDLMERIYIETKSFPKEEMWGMTSQMRRSSCSIGSNIAEGYGRVGRKDYIRHLGISRGSAYELKAQLLMCRRVGLISEEGSLNLVTQIIKMLTKLIASLEASVVREPGTVYGGSEEDLLDP